MTELFGLMARENAQIEIPELRNTLTVLQSRWEIHRQHISRGVLTAEEQQAQLSELSRDLLVFLNQLQAQQTPISLSKKNDFIPFWVSLFLLIIILALLWLIPCPSASQYHFFTIALALSAAGFTAVLPNFFQFYHKGFQLGGAMLVFFVVAGFDPARPVAANRCDVNFAQTIYVHGAKGMHDRQIVNQGSVVMLLPGGEREAGIDKEGKAVFTEIDAKWKGRDVQFYIRHDQPYTLTQPDSLYRLEEGRAIYLKAGLEGIDKLYGNITDENGFPLADVKVAIASIHTYTDSLGNFELHIPVNMQQKFQHVSCAKKGYIIFENAQTPIHTKAPFNVVLKRSN